MMEFALFIFIVVVLTIIPVMVSAKLLQAKNTSFWSCLLAVITSVAAEHIAQQLVSNPGFAGLLAVAITAVCFSLILGAKYIQSVLIALLAIGVQYGLALLLAGVGLAAGIATIEPI